MPEIAAVYATGFVVCLALTLVYVFLRERRRHSAAAQRLQAHLALVGLFWSDSADSLIPLEPTSAEDESRRSQRTIGYTGLILSLFSWAAVFFLLTVMISERFLARSRREKRLFSSELVSASNLSAERVARLINELDARNAAPSEVARPL